MRTSKAVEQALRDFAESWEPGACCIDGITAGELQALLAHIRSERRTMREAGAADMRERTLESIAKALRNWDDPNVRLALHYLQAAIELLPLTAPSAGVPVDETGRGGTDPSKGSALP